MLAQEPPRILLVIEDDVRRDALATALRDTGYLVVTSSTPCHSSSEGFDLAVSDSAGSLDSDIPTLFVSPGFDVIDVEMSVLDLLAWDGPPTVRRMPNWSDLSLTHEPQA